jgi:Short C-terminal domain
VSLRTVGLLLAVWCVLAIAPALVIAVLLGVDTEDPSGTVLLIWIGGYLAQIGVFLAITLKAGGGSFLGWLIASLVPWSANWVAPISPWWLIACTVVVGGYAWWFYRSLARSRSLQHDGVPARGVVLKVHKPPMNVVVNNVYMRRKLLLRIERADGVAPYEANFSGLFEIGAVPEPGSIVRLRVDPVNPRRFEAVNDGGEASHTSAQEASDTIAHRLQQLAELRRRGDLTEAEFTAAKRRILNG